MPVSKLDAKTKRTSRRSPLSEADKLRHAEELLKEVDSLALLLDQVKRQSQRIQAVADAIGDETFQGLLPGNRPALGADGATASGSTIGPKLVSRPRADRSFSL